MGPDGQDDDILRQVREALEAMDLGSADTRDALVGGVKDALDKVRDGLDDVASRVVERGKRHQAPNLRVVDPDDEDEGPSDGVDIDEVQDHVSWAGTGVGGVSPRRGLSVGAIHVPDPADDTASAWQTVLHAQQPTLIRLVCDEGQLEVAADGTSVCRLSLDQTIDVQAKVVRVSGVDGAAVGRYSQLG